MELTIVVPMFNESLRVPSTLVEIELFDKEYPGIIKEVLCIDDGSTDSTVEECMRFVMRMPLRIERFAENKGKWAAIHHGIRSAKTDAVLLLDADGAASIFELRDLIEKQGLDTIEYNKVTVFGSRFMKDSIVSGKGLFRLFISQGYRVFVKGCYLLARGRDAKKINDMQCPFKLVWRSMLIDKVITDDREVDLWLVDKWAGDIELACCVQGKIENYPVKFIHKRGSKLPMTSILNMAEETIRVVRRFQRIKKMHRFYIGNGRFFRYQRVDD